ncbi:MAG: hypothetical protein WAM62_15255 [Pseudolabrys sp.]
MEEKISGRSRLYVDFRGARKILIGDYISKLSNLVRTIAAFTYLLIDVSDRAGVLKLLNDYQISDYVYLDFDVDHPLDQLEIDMFVTIALHIHRYDNIQNLVSGRIKGLPAVVDVDEVPIDQILTAVKEAYLG